VPTLLIRLEGPMQSWGLSSRFTERGTAREPTKSGVIGLIAAAMGRDRSMPLDDLAAIKMSVRVEREGVIRKDFHTALDVPKANNNKNETSISNRYYLADACFLVGLEGPSELLINIRDAILNPVWPIYLGRKAFPPSSPIVIERELIAEPAEMVLRNYQWSGRKGERCPAKLRAIFECGADEGVVQMDVPISFEKRTFLPRFVRTEYITLPGSS
jgi:CRISPR system Cascade subunit CasD